MAINRDNSLASPDSDLYQHDVHSPRQEVPGEVEYSREPAADRLEEIECLDGRISSKPEIRETRIEQVRNAIDSGTYDVKADRIADKMIGGQPD